MGVLNSGRKLFLERKVSRENGGYRLRDITEDSIDVLTALRTMDAPQELFRSFLAGE